MSPTTRGTILTLSSFCALGVSRLLTRQTSTMQHYSGYTEAQLSECLHDIARLVLRLQYITAPRTVWEKYSSTRYLAVAPFCLRSINDQFPAIATVWFRLPLRRGTSSSLFKGRC